MSRRRLPAACFAEGLQKRRVHELGITGHFEQVVETVEQLGRARIVMIRPDSRSAYTNARPSIRQLPFQSIRQTHFGAVDQNSALPPSGFRLRLHCDDRPLPEGVSLPIRVFLSKAGPSW
jgi:hypothetical protein